MRKILKSIIKYKKKHFSSWIEFIMCFGLIPFEDGGYLIFI